MAQAVILMQEQDHSKMPMFERIKYIVNVRTDGSNSILFLCGTCWRVPLDQSGGGSNSAISYPIIKDKYAKFGVLGK